MIFWLMGIVIGGKRKRKTEWRMPFKNLTETSGGRMIAVAGERGLRFLLYL